MQSNYFFVGRLTPTLGLENLGLRTPTVIPTPALNNCPLTSNKLYCLVTEAVVQILNIKLDLV